MIVPPFRILQSVSDIFSVKNENPYNGQRPFIIWCPINSLTFLLLTGLLPCWSLCSSSIIPRPAFTQSFYSTVCCVWNALPQICAISLYLWPCLLLREVYHDPLLSCSWSRLPCAALSFSIGCVIISTHYILCLFSMATSFCSHMLAY